MAKKANLKPKRKKCKEYPYYKNYEAKRRESGKGARIKHKKVRRVVKKFVKMSPEYRHLAAYLGDDAAQPVVPRHGRRS